MKLFFDFLPVVLFFIAFKFAGIYVATAVIMLATLAQVGWSWWREGKVEKMPLVTLALVLVLGAATLWFQDETFVKWKPTLVNWLFALAFLASHYLGDKPLVQRLMGRELTLPDPIWLRLSWAWIAFFVSLGVTNLFVAYQFDTDTWVDFKLFGMLGLTLAFVIAQGFYLARHVKADIPDNPLSKE
ncbi:MAG TPA: septation protein A [Candidatus Competibacteraceae bacterium]|nr:septation protein A [Candidatus Competibacteraceae bacterium]